VQYIWTHEPNGEHLDGGKQYWLHLPPDSPVRIFWSVVVYDCSSQAAHVDGEPCRGLSAYNSTPNADGSVDLYFGPRPPNGNVKNWIRTVKGRSWFPHLRFYSPLEPCEPAWRPGDIVELKPGDIVELKPVDIVELTPADIVELKLTG
jgi:hypothetical protein